MNKKIKKLGVVAGGIVTAALSMYLYFESQKELMEIQEENRKLQFKLYDKAEQLCKLNPEKYGDDPYALWEKWYNED